jgi:hypothetical protein
LIAAKTQKYCWEIVVCRQLFFPETEKASRAHLFFPPPAYEGWWGFEKSIDDTKKGIRMQGQYG